MEADLRRTLHLLAHCLPMRANPPLLSALLLAAMPHSCCARNGALHTGGYSGGSNGALVHEGIGTMIGTMNGGHWKTGHCGAMGL
eukprot:1638274-Rhodomonas_salina.2